LSGHQSGRLRNFIYYKEITSVSPEDTEIISKLMKLAGKIKMAVIQFIVRQNAT
jgi:hypothetical protein